MDVANDPLKDLAAAIAAHPGCDRAVLHYAQTLLAWRQGPRLLNKLVSSHARTQIISYIMYLHYSADPADPDSGPTYLKLLALTERRKDCGPRALKTALALLRLAGFVHVSPGTNDRRLRIYSPTEKMQEYFRQWYTRTLGALDCIVEGQDYAARVLRDRYFLADLVVASGQPYIERRIPVVSDFPDLFELFAIEGGFPMTAALIVARLRDEPYPSPTSLAGQFGASASQMRNVLRKLSELGFVTVGEGGKVEDCTPLLKAFKAFIARELALYAKYALGLEQVLLGAGHGGGDAGERPRVAARQSI